MRYGHDAHSVAIDMKLLPARLLLKRLCLLPWHCGAHGPLVGSSYHIAGRNMQEDINYLCVLPSPDCRENVQHVWRRVQRYSWDDTPMHGRDICQVGVKQTGEAMSNFSQQFACMPSSLGKIDGEESPALWHAIRGCRRAGPVSIV